MTLLYTTNFTVSVDGSTPIRYLFTREQVAIHNFVAYDLQSLQFGAHNLDLMLLDSNDNSDHNSNFLFDYASVNESDPSVGGTSSPSATASLVSAPAITAKNAGAIAGGIIGGVAALACLYCLVLFHRRQVRSVTLSDLPPGGNPLVSEPILPSPPGFVNPAGIQSALQLSQDRPWGTRALDVPQDAFADRPTTTTVQRPSTIAPMSRSSLAPRGPRKLPTPLPSPPDPIAAPSLLSPPASNPPPADGSVPMSSLTNDQLSLLHHLSASNAPGPVLTAVAQSMVLGSQNRSGLETADNAEPPPEYSTVMRSSTTNGNLFAGT